MDWDAILSFGKQYGFPALLLLGLALAYWRKDKRVMDENKAREESLTSLVTNHLAHQTQEHTAMQDTETTIALSMERVANALDKVATVQAAQSVTLGKIEGHIGRGT